MNIEAYKSRRRSANKDIISVIKDQQNIDRLERNIKITTFCCLVFTFRTIYIYK